MSMSYHRDNMYNDSGSNIIQFISISIAIVCGLFVCLHSVRQWQTNTRGHGILCVAMLLSTIDFIMTALKYDAIYLSFIAELLSILVPTMLLAIWATSMHDHPFLQPNATIIRGIAYNWLIHFVIAATLMLVSTCYEAIYDAGHSTHLLFEHIGIGIYLTGCSILTSVCLWLFMITAKCQFNGKSQKRQQLIHLSVVFILFIISNIGRLLNLLPVYVIPYIIFHALFLISKESITKFAWVAEETAPFGQANGKTTHSSLEQSARLSFSLHTSSSSFFTPNQRWHPSRLASATTSIHSSQWTYKDFTVYFLPYEQSR
ncbi:hypothetical protein BDF22DRAFT_663509 [Syncephalis plumigaleata]|nr:hypothetical protein BDF22DRAFT_663509 [Syncephalis plumigaleata]